MSYDRRRTRVLPIMSLVLSDWSVLGFRQGVTPIAPWLPTRHKPRVRPSRGKTVLWEVSPTNPRPSGGLPVSTRWRSPRLRKGMRPYPEERYPHVWPSRQGLYHLFVSNPKHG